MHIRGRVLAALGAAVLAVTTIGGAAASSTTTAAPSEPAAVVQSVDERYIATMRWLVPGSAFEDSTDAELIQFAKNFCENGADASDLSKDAEVRAIFGISSGELRSILRVMAANYCPDAAGSI